MQQVKQTAEYTIYQKKSGRYAVQGPGKRKHWLHAEEKTKILVAEQLVTLPEPKKPAAEAEDAGEPAAS